MSYRLGINGATIPSADIVTGIRAAAAAGFSMFEPRTPKLLEANSPRRRLETRTILAETGLDWLPLNGLENLFAVPVHGLLNAAHTMCDLAAGFGISQIIAVPGVAERDISIAEAVDTLGKLREVAESHEQTFFYEFIGFPKHAFPTLAEASQVTQQARYPLVLDMFHLAVSETYESDIRQLSPADIGLVHLSDVMVSGASIRDATDADRVLPSEGQLPLEGYLRALGEIRYAGPMSIEVFHPKYGEIPAEEGARHAWARTCAALDQAGYASHKS